MTKKVLVVEDEADLRSLIVEKLRQFHYEVYEAQNGQEGLSAAHQYRPDVIVSDVLMPEKDGNKFFKEIRKSEFGKDIPFIVLTARAAMRDYFELIEVDAFLVKPFKMGELVDKIEELINKKKRAGASSLTSPQEQKAESKIIKLSSTEEELLRNREIAIEDYQKQLKPSEDLYDNTTRQEPKKETVAPYDYKIIVLEDDPATFMALKDVLEKQRIAAVRVTERDDCIRQAIRLKARVIILRDNPYQYHSLQLAERIKNVTELQKIPIIIYADIGEQEKRPDSKNEEPRPFVLNEKGDILLKRITHILKE